LDVSYRSLNTRETVSLTIGAVRPSTLVVLMAICQIVAWTLAPSLTHSSPPLDAVEGYMWGREWVLATYKHPAMPSWVLEASRLTTGVVGWPAYLAGQLFVAATFMFVYLLGRDLLGPHRAAAGVLLMCGIAFYAWPTTEFNHNVAEMPFWAAVAWAMWRAVESQRRVWWMLVGAFAAAGMYAKLTTALLLITLICWMLWDGKARQRLATSGPWIAVLTFAVLVLPLAQWLIGHNFLPLRYGVSRAEMAQGGALRFVATLLITAVGLFIVMGIGGLIRLRAPRHLATSAPTPDHKTTIATRANHYLMALTGGPIALTLMAAASSGLALKVAWGSSMLNLAGLLAVALTSHNFTEKALGRIVACALVLLVILPLGYAVVVLSWPWRGGRPMRANWPQAEISSRFTDLWKTQTGQPLKIVSGDAWIAGLVGITAADQPSILSGPLPSASPWITPERLEREGMLVVWNAKRRKMPHYVQRHIASIPVGQERFRWSAAPKSEDLVIEYALVLPQRLQR